MDRSQQGKEWGRSTTERGAHKDQSVFREGQDAYIRRETEPEKKEGCVGSSS